jgi:hypothetical protein
MIKKGAITPETPSFFSGHRGKTHMVKLGSVGAEPADEDDAEDLDDIRKMSDEKKENLKDG